jgi:beta-N-acetylhexosaminidase
MTAPDRLESTPLIVGLPGPVLGDGQRQLLEDTRPAGVILFSRNIVDAEQTRNLVADLGELEPRPFVCVDLEGGAVNRLEAIWGPLPSPSRCAAVGPDRVERLGEAAGAACHALGIQLDLAPVVDLFRNDGLIGRQERALSRDPHRAAELARRFVEGLRRWGVAGCLKHFPGLGAVVEDTHETLPILDTTIPEMDRHLEVFATLSQEIPLVMVGHVIAPSLGDSVRPTSLARSVMRLAADLPGNPVVITDDLEMGAMADQGDLPELVVRALRAEGHGVLVCHAFDRIPEIVSAIASEAASDPVFAGRLESGTARLSTLRRELCDRSSAVPAPGDEAVQQMWDELRKAVPILDPGP